jgi:hypothetical protein
VPFFLKKLTEKMSYSDYIYEGGEQRKKSISTSFTAKKIQKRKYIHKNAKKRQ